MEGAEQAGQNAVADAIMAEGALRISEIEEPRNAGPMEFLESLPRDTAMRGLAVALPMSLSLWTLIGLLFWVLLR
jgi:hypothetical protein